MTMTYPRGVWSVDARKGPGGSREGSPERPSVDHEELVTRRAFVVTLAGTVTRPTLVPGGRRAC